MIKGEHTFAEQINSVMKILPSRKYVESVLEFVDIINTSGENEEQDYDCS